jgi:DNA-binding transcriptional ArsR family regulator
LTGTGSALTDIGAKQGAWYELVRRARLSREQKLVALTFGSYAQADGAGIHCGIAALAVDCGIGYSTARRYVKWLRDVGLVELVRPGNQRRGLSDEYRLVFHPDLLKHLGDLLPTPDEHRTAKRKLRDDNRAGSASRSRRAAQNLRSPKSSAEPVVPPEPSALTPERAQKPAICAQIGGDLRSPMSERPPLLSTYPKEHTSPLPDGEDLRTEVAVDRPPDSQDPDFIEPQPPTLRLVEGDSVASTPADTSTPGLWPAAVPDPPRSDRLEGLGFCVPCYRAGKRVVVAADPDHGSVCRYHLRDTG